MSEYEISEDIAGRVNASNYDIADMIAIIDGEKVKEDVAAPSANDNKSA